MDASLDMEAYVMHAAGIHSWWIESRYVNRTAFSTFSTQLYSVLNSLHSPWSWDRLSCNCIPVGCLLQFEPNDDWRSLSFTPSIYTVDEVNENKSCKTLDCGIGVQNKLYQTLPIDREVRDVNTMSNNIADEVQTSTHEISDNSLIHSRNENLIKIIF